MGSEKFCLRWNDFENNISCAFRELRDDKDFFDVTLACDDEQIQAHKVILSACSPFFRNVLRRNPHSNPLLYLKGVKYTDLQSVLNFMYHGEVNVAQEELNSFLAVAEDLRVKGLTQNQAQSEDRKEKRDISHPYTHSRKTPSRSYEREPIPAPKQSRPVPATPTTINTSSRIQPPPQEEEIQEVVPVKTEPKEHTPSSVSEQSVASGAVNLYQAHSQDAGHVGQALAPVDDQGYQEHYEEYDEYGAEQQGYEMATVGEIGLESNKDPIEDLKKYIVRRDIIPECGICFNYSNKSSTNVRNHIESKHFPGMFSHKCDYCEKIYNSKQAVDKHRIRSHAAVNSNGQIF